MPIIDPYVEYYSKKEYDELFLTNVKTIDLWNDKLLYGRVDEFQNSVYISNDGLEQKIKQLDIRENQLFALNFVADAFNDFRRYVERANSLGRIKPDGIFSSLNPKRAYTNMESAYNQHLGRFYDIFLIYLNNTGKIQSILELEDFVQEMLLFLSYFPGRLPLTRTTYIKSKFFNPLSTGLIIELFNTNHNDDSKREQITTDSTFDFYQKGARKHGFFIAKHAPWRLIADISSIPMQNYMSPTAEFLNVLGDPVIPATYGLDFSPGTASNLFSARHPSTFGEDLPPYYLKSYLSDIEDLKINIAAMWNRFVGDNPNQVTTVKCSKPGKDADYTNNTAAKFNRYKKVIKKRKPLPKNSQLVLKYFSQSVIMTDRFFMIAYKNILRHENNILLPEEKNKRLDKTILKYYDSLGVGKTVNFINNYFKKVKGTTANPSYCQTYSFCQEEQQKNQTEVSSNVTIIQDTTTPTAGGTPSGGSGTSGGGY